MKAVVIRRFGGPEVLEVAELDAPEPMAGQVRIHVQAAAVNPVDIATRAGRLTDAGLAPAAGQIGIGWDLAGVIDALGPGVDRFRDGDPVIAMRDLLSAPVGAQAEYVVLDADAVAAAPRSVSPLEAATVPLNGLTAAQALDLLALDAGQWLLVTGAAGAVGGFALELASLRGLRTVAVASPATSRSSAGSVPTSSCLAPRTSARRSVAPCRAASTGRLTRPSSACRRLTASATAVPSSPSGPKPRPPRCVAPACTTSGSAPTLHAWQSWRRSSTRAVSPLGWPPPNHWTRLPPHTSDWPPAASGAASSWRRPDDQQLYHPPTTCAAGHPTGRWWASWGS